MIRFYRRATHEALHASGLYALHSLPNIQSRTARKEKKKKDVLLIYCRQKYATVPRGQASYSHKVSHTHTRTHHGQRLAFIDATSHLAAADRKLSLLFLLLVARFQEEDTDGETRVKCVGSKTHQSSSKRH